MAIYRIFPEKDTTIWSEPNTAGLYGNAGKDPILTIGGYPDTNYVGRTYRSLIKFKTKDIADYKEHHLKNYDVLICTSCEHIDDLLINSFLSKKRKDSLVVLQSNNFIGIEDHINCKKSLKDFKNSINLNVQYEGTKSFEKYDRYMIIGT